MGARDDDLSDFRPRIGKRERARDRVVSSSHRVAMLVRRGHGRGGQRRTPIAAPPSGYAPRHNVRRVIVKAHVQRLTRHGAQAAVRHLRYIERDGVEKDGSKGVLYGPDGTVAREDFEQPRLGERHQFRFIVSPEDGRDLELTDYVERLMSRVGRDLGRRIEWAAVNHYDTEHPHAHVVVRGVDLDGQQLRMERAYIARGLRWSAQDLATELLGPRLALEIRRTREREVAQERFTSLDRELERATTERRVDADALVARKWGPEPDLLVRRLEQLEDLGLAERHSARAWVLADGWQDQLRVRGERGDILKQMHLAMHDGDPKRFHVVRKGQGLPDGCGGVEERELLGRVVRKGLADELKGTFYAVLETPTGDAYHVPIAGRAADALQSGQLVSFRSSRESHIRPVDRQIAEAASSRGGVYELALGHARTADGKEILARLRELERLGLVQAQSPGQWTVTPDLLEQLEDRGRMAPRYRLSVQPVVQSLDVQAHHPGPVWLDSVDTESLSPRGWGAEVRAATEERRRALRKLGIHPDSPERTGQLQELERRAVGKDIAHKVGRPFLELTPERFRGQLEVVPKAAYVAVTDGRSFVLLPATPEALAWRGQTVEVSRDRAGRVVLAEDPERIAERQELDRRAVGEALARETRRIFLEKVPSGFRGSVLSGPAGAPYLAVADGARFVLVLATPETLALRGTTVEVSADARGRVMGLRPAARDRDRGPDRGR